MYACADCDATCGECSGTGSTDCTSCQTDEHRVLSSGSCDCDSGYTEDTATGHCMYGTCNAKCLTCDGPNDDECVTCDDAAGFTLTYTSCVCAGGGWRDSNDDC